MKAAIHISFILACFGLTLLAWYIGAPMVIWLPILVIGALSAFS